MNYEFIRMPDSTGFGDYTESGQVIPVRYQGETGGYTPPDVPQRPSADRRRAGEIWGFPKKLAQPSLAVETDTLVGTLNYGSVRVATGDHGLQAPRPRHRWPKRKGMAAPNFLLKVIPHVDGRPRGLRAGALPPRGRDREGRLDRAGHRCSSTRMPWRPSPSCRCSRFSRPSTWSPT